MITITINRGMIDIDDDGIAYANIQNMYENGHGVGLQLNKELEPLREEILTKCNLISSTIYKLQDKIKEVKNARQK